MGAFMGKSKASLTAKLVDLSRLNKTDIQQNLIFPEWNGSLHAHLFYDVLSVRIGGQAADASIRGQTGKRHIHVEVFLGELVNRCPSRHTPGAFGFTTEKELIEVLGHGCCNFFDFQEGSKWFVEAKGT